MHPIRKIPIMAKIHQRKTKMQRWKTNNRTLCRMRTTSEMNMTSIRMMKTIIEGPASRMNTGANRKQPTTKRVVTLEMDSLRSEISKVHSMCQSLKRKKCSAGVSPENCSLPKALYSARSSRICTTSASLGILKRRHEK